MFGVTHLELMFLLWRNYPANISCFPRRLQDIFSVTLFVIQNLEDVLGRRVANMSWRRLEDVLQDVLKDVFAIRLTKTFSRRLQDVFKTCLQDVLQLCLQDVYKTSSRRLGRQKNVTLKTPWRGLQDVFSTSSPKQMFAGREVYLLKQELKTVPEWIFE